MNGKEIEMKKRSQKTRQERKKTHTEKKILTTEYYNSKYSKRNKQNVDERKYGIKHTHTRAQTTTNQKKIPKTRHLKNPVKISELVS